MGNVRTSQARWFRQQRIVGRKGESLAPAGLYVLAAAAVSDAKDLSPHTPRALLRAALVGRPLPLNLLSEAVRRNSAERGLTLPRTDFRSKGLRAVYR